MRAVMIGLLAAGFLMVTVSADAGEDKVPSVSEIMKKLNKGPKSVHQSVGKQLKGEEPLWDDIIKLTKEYVSQCSFMEKNKPDVGDADSWAKFCKSYFEDAKALEVAVGKKDKKASLAAWTKIGKSCEGCHDAHR